MDKETIIATYKAVGRSLLNYAAPIWTSFLSDTQWRALQTTQNNVLRIATGCVKMTSIDHLHQESCMLIVRKHNELLTKQYLIACYLSTTNYRTVMNNPSRRIRLDFTTFKSDITHIIPTIDNLRFVREAQNSLHQTSDMIARNEHSHNRVINRHPLPITDTER